MNPIVIRGVPLFESPLDFVHVALGAATVFYPQAAVAIILGFLFWQIREDEPRQNTTGDFAEFLSGMAGARVYQMLRR